MVLIYPGSGPVFRVDKNDMDEKLRQLDILIPADTLSTFAQEHVCSAGWESLPQTQLSVDFDE